MTPRLHSEVTFASFLVYAPRPRNELEERSRRAIRSDLKNDRNGVIDLVARRLRQMWPIDELTEALSADVVFVPVPGSSPRSSEDSLWVPQRICAALNSAGFGRGTLPLLRRTRRVPRSGSSSSADGRPSPLQHFESIDVELPLAVPDRVRLVLVDDVVTRGATLLACASRLHEAFPSTPVTCFAIARTMSEGFDDSIEDLKVPVRGAIRLTESGATQRRP